MVSVSFGGRAFNINPLDSQSCSLLWSRSFALTYKLMILGPIVISVSIVSKSSGNYSLPIIVLIVLSLFRVRTNREIAWAEL